MRTCSSCHAADRIFGPEAESEHWVKPEIRYVAGREALTARDEARGWQYRVFQGRPALERLQCVDCLRRNAERDRLWSELRGQARELEAEAQGGDSQAYFRLLCET